VTILSAFVIEAIGEEKDKYKTAIIGNITNEKRVVGVYPNMGILISSTTGIASLTPGINTVRKKRATRNFNKR
jgi:hypothetical protein